MCQSITKVTVGKIDIDIPSDRRIEVMEHCREYFGQKCVSNIITFGKYTGKNLVQAVGKSLGIDKDIISECCSYIYFSLSGALEGDAFQEYLEENEEANYLIEMCKPLEGCVHHASSHAAGMLIADSDMTNYTPYTNGKNGITSQYPFETLEKIGCLKVDLLGHEAEVVIDRACQYIEENHGVKIIPREIPIDDKNTFKMLQKCDVRGVPQIEKDWVLDIVQDVHPTALSHIIDLVTIIRPGSLDSGQTTKYRKIRKGELEPTPDIPQVADITEETYGCLSKNEKIFGHSMTIGQMYASGKYGTALSMNEDDILSENIIEGMRYAGRQETFLVTMEDDKTICCTIDHKFPTPKGKKPLSELRIGDELYVVDRAKAKILQMYKKSELVALCKCGKTYKTTYNHFKLSSGKCELCRQNSNTRNTFYLLSDMKTVKVYNSDKTEYFYIDLDDVGIVSKYTWDVCISERTKYVINNTNGIWLHDYLTDRKYVTVNHKDFNGLNNKRNNLEGSSFENNQQYRQLSNGNSSGYMGVSKTSDKKKYRAYLTHNREMIHIGTYPTKLEAAIGRDNFVKEYNKVNGTNYNLNFDMIKYSDNLDELKVVQRLFVNETYFTKLSKIKSIESIGIDDVFDISMKPPYHNFLVKSGIVTSNCWLYQEQVMDVVKNIAGFTLGQADDLRKVVAKTKYKDKADKLMDLFKEQGMSADYGITEPLTYEQWQLMDETIRDFFKYAFNKAHAAGYGTTSYRCAYLKANYFIEYMTALLNSKDNKSLPFYLDNIYEHGYVIEPPNINVSGWCWTCVDGILRPALSVIMSCGPSVVNAIVEERELNGDFESFEDFLLRTPSRTVKKNVVENLICAGVFDSLGYSRKVLWKACEEDDYIAKVRKTTLIQGKGLPKDGEEFGIEEIQEDEEYLMGFVVTLTDKEIDKRRNRILRKVKKYREYVYHESTSKRNLKMRSKTQRTETELNNIKQKRNKLNSKMNGNKENSDDNDDVIDVDAVEITELFVRVDSNDKKVLTKIFTTIKKSDSESKKEYHLIFVVNTNDDNQYKIVTKQYVDVKTYAKIRKIVGGKNVWIE